MSAIFCWVNIRSAVSVMLLAGVCATLGKVLLLPPELPRVAPFAFPVEVPLDGWRSVAETASQSNAEMLGPTLLAEHRYGYERAGISLEIEMRYLADSDGEMHSHLPNDVTPPQDVTVRNWDASGSYALWSSGQRTYLSAFINPHGGTTVDSGQFMRSRYQYDLRAGRIMPWLLGRAPLRDKRCLLVHMSVPLDAASSEKAAVVLEEAWSAWVHWWQSRFPNPHA